MPAVISMTNSLYPFGRSEGDTVFQLQPDGLAPAFIPFHPILFLGTIQDFTIVSALPSP